MTIILVWQLKPSNNGFVIGNQRVGYGLIHQFGGAIQLFCS